MAPRREGDSYQEIPQPQCQGVGGDPGMNRGFGQNSTLSQGSGPIPFLNAVAHGLQVGSLLKAPPKYDGTTEKDAARLWLVAMEQWFLTHKRLNMMEESPDTFKIAIATTALTQGALQWWQNLAMQYGAGVESEPWGYIWPEWKTIFLDYFGDLRSREQSIDHFRDLRSREQLIDQFDSLRQEGSIPDFLKKIRLLGLELGVDDQRQMTIFRRGLKPQIRKRIESLPDHLIPDEFNKYALFAKKQEDELARQVRSFNAPDFKASGNSKQNEPNKKIKVDSNGDIEMALNAISTSQIRKHLKKRGERNFKQKCREQNLCFSCGQPDHRINECPNRASDTGKAKSR